MTLNRGDTLLNGQYQILRQLGRGGFGVVHLAKNTLLDEEVAVKELILTLASDQELVKRFLAEAKATMRLTNEHIVRTHNVFSEGGNYYIVMEYMVGGSVEERLEQQLHLSTSPAVRIATEVCEGLDYAHRQGIVHCDLKPANILFGAKGSAKVCDFGIAHVSEQMLSRTWETRPGSIVGTLPYMSPEQIEGIRDDPRLDIYALGAVLYHMLTGRTYLDFDPQATPGSLADDVMRIRSEQPVPPSTHNSAITSSLDRVVLKALAKSPLQRYSSADDLRAALLQSARAKVPARVKPPAKAKPPVKPKPSVKPRAPAKAKGKPVRSPGQPAPAAVPGRMKQQGSKRRMRTEVVVLLLVFGTLALCVGGAFALFSTGGGASGTAPLPPTQAVRQTNTAYPTRTPASSSTQPSGGTESCTASEYVREGENLLGKFQQINDSVMAATEAQDVGRVQELMQEFQTFQAQWSALAPPHCAETTDKAMRNAWTVYRVMLRAWLDGHQSELDASIAEWQTAATAATDQWALLLNVERYPTRAPAPSMTASPASTLSPSTATQQRPSETQTATPLLPTAPTLAPTPVTSQAGTPLPSPVATRTATTVPTPSPAQTANGDTAQMRYPAPELVDPHDGQAFTGRDTVLLQWKPVGDLPADAYYKVALGYSPRPGVTWYDETPWLKEPQWTMSEHDYLLDMSVDGLFQWSVQVVRKGELDAQGNAQETALSPMSEERSLIWRASGPPVEGPDH